MEEELSIRSTKDHSIFNKLSGNRNINNNHLKSLVASMKKENLLALKPILVNELMEVVDGQHRLEAAKELDLEIYYLIISKTGARQVSRINSHQKNWKNEDYLNLYVEAFASEEYIKLKSFMSKYNFDLNISFSFLDYPIRKIEKREEFQQGGFVFPTDEESLITLLSKYNSINNLIKHHNIKPAVAFSSIIFVNSLIRFIKSKKISWDVFWKKLEDNWVRIGKRYNVDQYLDMFLDIYNVHSPYKILINELY